MAQHFIAFSSTDRYLAETITAAALDASTGEVEYIPWTRQDASGAPLGRSVESWLDAAEGVIADITFVNENVTYEIGYAIGAGKPIRLIRNESISPNDLKLIGLLDTVLRDPYRTRHDLIALLKSKPAKRNTWHKRKRNKDQPLFILSPPKPTPFSTGLMSAVKKSMRLKFRSFNPRETARLTADEAWESVASSFGVIVTWRDGSDREDQRNNQRAALIFGMARGMEIPALLIAHTRATLPLDLVDQTTRLTSETELPQIAREFRDEVLDSIGEYIEAPKAKSSLLETINCGQAEAENEQDQLPQYFLETEEFRNTLDGKTNLVIGRKGSGKSAIFYQVRDRIRSIKKNIVVDLSPEGYQLIKLRELIGKLTGIGIRKEFISAFWQYVLLLEIAYKILEKDANAAKRDGDLLPRYERLQAAFSSRVDTGTGDFSERLRLLTDSIETRFAQHTNTVAAGTIMSSQILQIVYGSDIAAIRTEILSYLKLKGIVLFLFDNLDRMRAPGGFDDIDSILILGLIESLQEITKHFRRDKFIFKWVVFIRSDVYEFVVRAMADYSKQAQQSLEWQDRGLLSKLLQRRIMNSIEGSKQTWEAVWPTISTQNIGDKNVFDFLIEASLMRPRYLIRLFESARRRACNIGNKYIQEDDYLAALSELGWTIIEDINLELRDIVSEADSLLFDLGHLNGACGLNEITDAIARRVGATDVVHRVIDVLLWSGAVGIIANNKIIYIYDCGYKLGFLHSLINNQEDLEFCLHPTVAGRLKL